MVCVQKRQRTSFCGEEEKKWEGLVNLSLANAVEFRCVSISTGVEYKCFSI